LARQEPQEQLVHQDRLAQPGLTELQEQLAPQDRLARQELTELQE
jgi:hypothetical protein